MKNKPDYHYFESAPYNGKDCSGKSVTMPGQGFRPKDMIARMIAGAPPPVGKEPIYIDPSYGVDPLARFDMPIEELQQLSESYGMRIRELQELKEQHKADNPPPADPPPPVPTE